MRERDARRRGGHDRRPHPPKAPEAPASADPAPGRRAAGGCDPAVDRVRSAGGPLDNAVYNSCCGYLFSAAVSTTVVCPHCGTDQAW